MSDVQDDQIARGLRAGRSEAWAALYDAYFERIWTLAGRMIGPDVQAICDVVQETFLSAARSAGGFDADRGPLWLWLSGICRNCVAMHFRTRRRDGRIRPGGDLETDLAGRLAGRHEDASGPAEASMLAEQARDVRATLAGMSEEYRSVLTYRYLQDVPVEHLADMMGCSPAAVHSRLARARQAFRQAFESRRRSSPPAAGRSGATHDHP